MNRTNPTRRIFFSIITGFILTACGLSAAYRQETVFITMKDGTRLASDLYLPESDAKVPCVLIRTPYRKEGSKKECEWFAEAGIAVLCQDCRGKFSSEGEFYPFVNERQDGLETLRWIRKQPWSDGKIGGWGGSYVGYTQWAVSDSLDAMVPLLTTAEMYEGMYPAGLFSLATVLNWGLVVDSRLVNQVPAEKMAASCRILPLTVADDSTVKDIRFIDDWLTHSGYDDYWKAQGRRGSTRIPVFSAGGWYDIFCMAQISDFQALGDNAHPDSRLVMTQNCHGSQGRKNEYGGEKKTGDPIAMGRDFLIRHLRGDGNILKPPFHDRKYNLFIMERNEYYGSDEWPPLSTRSIPYYLYGGKILEDIPGESGELSYVYDPEDPYPSLGGTALGAGVGPALQNPNQARIDQLVFEGEPLKQALTLLGPIGATLYVESDAPATDFILCLQDVFPDGDIVNIQEGGITVQLKKKGPEKINFSVWATGYELKEGHRLRVAIVSAWFPRFNRNLNTGEPIATGTKMQKAIQKVYFGKGYPSSVDLPVLEE